MTVTNGRRVTVGNSPLSSGQFQTDPRERETAPPAPETLHSPITASDAGPGWTSRAAGWLRGFFALPSPLAERAPAVEQILDYARNAPWTARTDGPLRAAGVAFCWLVAVPAVVALRVAEWPFTRPSRLLFTALTVKLLAELPPVEWFTDHIVKPGADWALWLFL
ncbi:hypothetical protein NMK34_23775 [Micromonospora sp. BRA006-A]|uniref:hypothetical protein n=1 Tax=Micromonospora sp. BRA006-A TaxID=2962860 RepID=UPI00296F623B|nr:hypothetical protein [Micromonospora sp. BRA006-A]MDW3849637.1 hypothetical protein [Micromonospora sp. BRA006-A]